MITLDTNVLVYLADDDDPLKQAVAGQLVEQLSERRQPLGLQVIGELQNVLRRKLKQPPWLAAQIARNAMQAFVIFPPSVSAAETALALLAAGRFSYWDGLLLAAARETGCTAILTEDMQDGAVWNGLQIINPFGVDGLSDRARNLLDATC